MPENKTVKNMILRLAMLVFAIFCLYTLCPAEEAQEVKSEQDMSDSERLYRALQKKLKSGELSPLSPKAKAASDTKAPKYTPDKADKIIDALTAKNLTDAQITIQAMKMAQDLEEMLIVLKRLADMGNCKAMTRLGNKMIHACENEPHYDLEEGFRLLVTAARAGDAQAQYWLGVATALDRRFDTTDRTQLLEAYRWHYASAEQGYAHAQCKIGQMLARGHAPNSTGRLVPTQEDYIEAYKWLTLAIKRYTAVPIEKGSIYAEWARFPQSSRNYLVKEGYVNEDQITEALKRVQAWEKSHPNAYRKFPANELD